MKISQSAGSRVLAPEGNHTARLIRIVDCGSQYSELYKKSSRKIRLTFELTEESHTWDEKEGPKPFVVDRMYTMSLSKKATLRKSLESWLGKQFEDKDFVDGGFDMAGLVGSAGMIQLAHVESNGTTYCNIQSLASPAKGMKIKKAVNTTYLFDLDSPDKEIYETFPEWLQELISEAPEFNPEMA